MSNDIFKNEVVMQKFNPLQQFEAYYKGDKSLCFMYYPFLLTAQYKNVRLRPLRNSSKYRPRSSTRIRCKKGS